MDPAVAPSPWGKSVAINLFNCKRELISNPKIIQKFIRQVIKYIEMRSHGPCYIERFGDGQLEGYSAMQFIETSSITLHADEVHSRCFVDIFSCKDFDTDRAANFTKDFFGSESMSSASLTR